MNSYQLVYRETGPPQSAKLEHLKGCIETPGVTRLGGSTVKSRQEEQSALKSRYPVGCHRELLLRIANSIVQGSCHVQGALEGVYDG